MGGGLAILPCWGREVKKCASTSGCPVTFASIGFTYTLSSTHTDFRSGFAAFCFLGFPSPGSRNRGGGGGGLALICGRYLKMFLVVEE